MLRLLLTLTVLAITPSAAVAQYYPRSPSSSIVENPFYTALKQQEAAERKAKIQLNKDIKDLRNHLEKGGLFKVNSLENMNRSEVRTLSGHAKELYAKYSAYHKELNGKNSVRWLEQLSDSNREFVDSGTMAENALPLLRTQMIQASRLDAKLQRKWNDAQQKKDMLTLRNRKLQHSNDFGLDYERYKRNKHSYDQKTREAVEKAAIVDILNDRDLDAIDAKLRALGY